MRRTRYVARELAFIGISLLGAGLILYGLFGGQIRSLRRAAATWLAF